MKKTEGKKPISWVDGRQKGPDIMLLHFPQPQFLRSYEMSRTTVPLFPHLGDFFGGQSRYFPHFYTCSFLPRLRREIWMLKNPWNTQQNIVIWIFESFCRKKLFSKSIHEKLLFFDKTQFLNLGDRALIVYKNVDIECLVWQIFFLLLKKATVGFKAKRVKTILKTLRAFFEYFFHFEEREMKKVKFFQLLCLKNRGSFLQLSLRPFPLTKKLLFVQSFQRIKQK